MKSFTLFAALLLPLTLAAPVEEIRADEEMVRTPAGLRPTSKVHLVPDGGEVRLVGEEIHLLDATGSVLHVATNDHAKVGMSQATATTTGAEPEETGWVAYASWLNEASAAISSFATSFTVPPLPEDNHDQTLFMFNSIEPASGDAILQPVLQFGPSAAGGGADWAVASWYLVGSETFFSSLVPTSAGTVLNGLITLTSSSGADFNYDVAFTGISGTALTATKSAELVWATETLETYGTTTGEDYPAGSLTFHAINLEMTSGTPETVWSTVSDTADKLITEVVTPGFSNAEIVISFPQA